MDTKTEQKSIEIIDSREDGSMVSSWNEYLCLCKGDTKRYRLFVGRYEPLVEASEFFNEETEDYDLPTHIDGVVVVGIEDDYVVGGELQWFSDEHTIQFDKPSESAVRAWLNRHEWWNEIVQTHLAFRPWPPRDPLAVQGVAAGN
jgi:hypothetical protein